ncbi:MULTISPECIES: hypothetical protein [Paenibacillus]|uniref:DUF4367 domain-containing protein n=1 Tax=Paenibacillus lautus TaxID=1401 RepID=A0A1R1B0B3_PAELA|nr:hypothetical protein [Paenibacillus lautus]OME91947.1 hypothetical protein BK123_14975 [Paenibacillus lautus]
MGSIVDPIEELRQHSVPDSHFRDVEFVSRVRQHIEDEQHKSRSGFRSFKRKTVLSIMISSVLLVSFTAYAATGHIQIFNSKGEIVLKTAHPSSSGLPAKLSNLLEEYRTRVKSMLKPGELAAYYIKDDYINKDNGYDTVNPIKFEYQPIDYLSYENFQKELVRTSAPILEVPGNLPKGVKFAYGQVFPFGPAPSGEKDRVKYVELEQRLMNEANSSKSGDKLFVEKLDWSKAFNSIVYLSDGKSSTAVSIMAAYGQGASLTKSLDASSEKVQLKHVEAIYLHDEADGDSISWYDSKQNIVYTIMVNVKGLMTKNDLQAMAESMIID